MVIKERQKRVTIGTVEETLIKHNCQERIEIMEDLKSRGREPRREPPPGSICLREAARKYGISHPTLSRRVKDGTLKVVERTKNWLYIDESALKQLINRH